MNNENINDNTTAELEKLSFEEALVKLEASVSKMESGNLPLEDMMKAFEEGQNLAAVCAKKLQAVEKKIEILKKRSGSDGEWVDFNDTPAQTRNAPSPIQEQPVQFQDQEDENLLF